MRPTKARTDSALSSEMASPRQCFSPSTQVTGSPQSAAGNLSEENHEFQTARCFSSQFLSEFNLPPRQGQLFRSASSVTSKEAEIARLHAELSACSLLEALRGQTALPHPSRAADQTSFNSENVVEIEGTIVGELSKVTKALSECREVIKNLETELGRLRGKVDMLEGDVEEEKEYARKEKERLMTAMKQLLEAKSNCESELSTLYHSSTAEIQALKDRENQLQSELNATFDECQKLKAVIETGKQSETVIKAVRKREEELDRMTKEMEEREERVRVASGKVAQERSDHFRMHNLLLQENEHLRLDNESLKSQLNFLTRNPPPASPLFSFMSTPRKSTRPLDTAPETSRQFLKPSSRREPLSNSGCSCLLM